MTTLECLDIGVKLLQFISIGIAAFSLFRSSSYAKRQWNFDTFTHYTKRYDEIMGSFPQNAYMLRFELNRQVKSDEKIRLAVLKYLNMTAEEYYLQSEKYLDAKVWEIWLPEIERTLKTPLFVNEWQNLKHEFRSYPKFSAFVEKVQSERILRKT